MNPSQPPSPNHYFLKQTLRGNERNWFKLVLKLHPKYPKSILRAQPWRNASCRGYHWALCKHMPCLHHSALLSTASCAAPCLGRQEMETSTLLFMPAHSSALNTVLGQEIPPLLWGCSGHWRHGGQCIHFLPRYVGQLIIKPSATKLLNIFLLISTS